MLAALSLRGVEKSYRAGTPGCWASVSVLRGVTLDAHVGELLAIVGARGSGLSTLLACAAGVLRPDSGSVRWFGRAEDAAGPPPGIALATGRGAYYSCLTVREALEYYATFRDLPATGRAKRVASALDRTGLGPIAERPAASLPPPTARRLALAQALVEAPRILLADDPLAGVDAATAAAVARMLGEVASEGTAVVVTTCGARRVELKAARTLALEDGRVRPPAPADHRWLELRVERPRAAADVLRAHGAILVDGRGTVAVPLERASPEEVLAACRSHGVPVLGSRVASGGGRLVAESAPER